MNELAAKKRDVASELALRPDDAPSIPPGDGGASYRKLVANLRLHSLEGEADEREAARLVRGLVRRVTVTPREDDEPQGLVVEAGYSDYRTTSVYDCNNGCGGPQPS